MFRVRWRKVAIDGLTAAWIRADPVMRKAITKATHEIDRQLSRDPEQGEDRPDGQRIAFAFPVGVFYQVDTSRSVVYVHKAWIFQRRS